LSSNTILKNCDLGRFILDGVFITINFLNSDCKGKPFFHTNRDAENKIETFFPKRLYFPFKNCPYFSSTFAPASSMSFQGFGFVFADAFFDGFWCCIYDVFIFFQPEAGQFFDEFHNFQFFGACFFQYDVEGGLFFVGSIRNYLLENKHTISCISYNEIKFNGFTLFNFSNIKFDVFNSTFAPCGCFFYPQESAKTMITNKIYAFFITFYFL